MDAVGTSVESRPVDRYFSNVPREIRLRGKPKGAKNRIGASVRLGILEVWRQCGGVDGMVKWAKEKPDLFYPLLAKLLPMELAESGAGVPIRVLVYAPQAEPQARVSLEEPQAEITTSGPDIK